jgi:hypothetical protein
MGVGIYPGATPGTVSICVDQVRGVLRRAWQNPGRSQFMLLCDCGTGDLVAAVRLWNAPGGRLLIHPADAGTELAAALGSAFERAGCMNRLGIAPKPFPCPLPAELKDGGRR